MSHYALVWTRTFERTLRKFLRRHPDLAGEVASILRQLERDPRAPRLRLHRLKGLHSDKHAVSLTYSQRLVLILKTTPKEVVLLDIGDHDHAYR